MGCGKIGNADPGIVPQLAPPKDAGLLEWLSPLTAGGAPPVFQAAVKAQSHNAIGQAGLSIGRHNLIRIDAAEGNRPVGLDDVDRACRELPEDIEDALLLAERTEI